MNPRRSARRSRLLPPGLDLLAACQSLELRRLLAAAIDEEIPDGNIRGDEGDLTEEVFWEEFCLPDVAVAELEAQAMEGPALPEVVEETEDYSSEWWVMAPDDAGVTTTMDFGHSVEVVSEEHVEPWLAVCWMQPDDVRTEFIDSQFATDGEVIFADAEVSDCDWADPDGVSQVQLEGPMRAFIEPGLEGEAEEAGEIYEERIWGESELIVAESFFVDELSGSYDDAVLYAETFAPSMVWRSLEEPQFSAGEDFSASAIVALMPTTAPAAVPQFRAARSVFSISADAAVSVADSRLIASSQFASGRFPVAAFRTAVQPGAIREQQRSRSGMSWGADAGKRPAVDNPAELKRERSRKPIPVRRSAVEELQSAQPHSENTKRGPDQSESVVPEVAAVAEPKVEPN